MRSRQAALWLCRFMVFVRMSRPVSSVKSRPAKCRADHPLEMVLCNGYFSDPGEISVRLLCLIVDALI